MKKYVLLLLSVIFYFSVMGQPVGMNMTRMDEMDIALPAGVGALTFELDPFAPETTVYFTNTAAGPGLREVYKIVDPLGENGGPDIIKVLDVPIYREGGQENWIQWTYLSGLAVTEEYLFVGGNTFIASGEAAGFYIIRYNKADYTVDAIFQNNVTGHRSSYFMMYDAGEEVSYYVNSAGAWVDADDPDAIQHTGQYALVAAQAGRGVFTIDPEGDFEYGDPAGTQFQRNFRPLAWAQTVRTTSRDIAFDYESGDLYIAASGESAAVTTMHAMWGGRYGVEGSLYPDGFPAFDGPGVVRMRGYDPFQFDWGTTDGEDTISQIYLPPLRDNQNNAAVMGIHLLNHNGDKFLFVSDYWNTRFLIYNLQNIGEQAITYQLSIITDSQAWDSITVEDSAGDIYLLISFGGTIHVYQLDIAPTFSASWSLFY